MKLTLKSIVYKLFIKNLRFYFSLSDVGQWTAGAAAGAIPSVVQGAFSWLTNKDRNSSEAANVDKTNALNKQIAEENLAFQQKQFEYQQSLNEKQMQREDSQYQRTVADMRAAGLSPLTMQGLNSSTPGVAGTPLDNSMQYQSSSVTAPQIPQFSNMLEAASKFVSDTESIKSQKLQNDAQEIENKFSNLSFASRLAQFMNQESEQTYRLWNMAHDQRYKQFTGVADSMDSREKLIRTILAQLGVTPSNDKHSYGKNKVTRLSDGNFYIEQGSISDFPNFNYGYENLNKGFEKAGKLFGDLLNKAVPDVSSILSNQLKRTKDNFKEKVKNFFGGK